MGNFPQILMFRDFGTPGQKDEFINGMLKGTHRVAFGLTEPYHGSDAAWMETKARRDGNGWRLSGENFWNTGVHAAHYDRSIGRYISARISPGDGIFFFP